MRRNYCGAHGWMIYLPASGNMPGGYAHENLVAGWVRTVAITAAANFDTYSAADLVRCAEFNHYRGAAVTPCVPGAVITHTGPTAIPIRSYSDG